MSEKKSIKCFVCNKKLGKWANSILDIPHLAHNSCMDKYIKEKNLTPI